MYFGVTILGVLWNSKICSIGLELESNQLTPMWIQYVGSTPKGSMSQGLRLISSTYCTSFSRLLGPFNRGLVLGPHLQSLYLFLTTRSSTLRSGHHFHQVQFVLVSISMHTPWRVSQRHHVFFFNPSCLNGLSRNLRSHFMQYLSILRQTHILNISLATSHWNRKIHHASSFSSILDLLLQGYFTKG